jgi:hypothetical protein
MTKWKRETMCVFCGDETVSAEDRCFLNAYADFDHPEWHIDSHEYAAHASCFREAMHPTRRWAETAD